MPEFPEERTLAILQLVLLPGVQERAGKKEGGGGVADALMHRQEKWEKILSNLTHNLFVHIKRGWKDEQ